MTTLPDMDAVFRSLKSEFGLRPIFHHKERRTDGHLFISALACQCVQVIRTRLRNAGIRDSWDTLRKTLCSQARTTTCFARPDGRTLHVRKTVLAEPWQAEIHTAFGLDPPRRRVRKTLF